MATLIVRNLDEDIVKALKIKADLHGISAEAEHRNILESVLRKSRKKSFSEVLQQIPISQDTEW